MKRMEAKLSKWSVRDREGEKTSREVYTTVILYIVVDEYKVVLWRPQKQERGWKAETRGKRSHVSKGACVCRGGNGRGTTDVIRSSDKERDVG